MEYKWRCSWIWWKQTIVGEWKASSLPQIEYSAPQTDCLSVYFLCVSYMNEFFKSQIVSYFLGNNCWIPRSTVDICFNKISHYLSFHCYFPLNPVKCHMNRKGLYWFIWTFKCTDMEKVLINKAQAIKCMGKNLNIHSMVILLDTLVHANPILYDI